MTASSTYTGIGVGRSVALGPVVQAHGVPAIPSDGGPARTPGDVDAAFDAVASELGTLARRADGPLAEVLAATAAMATDPALRSESLKALAAGTPAALAVDQAAEQFLTLFEAAGGYLAERVTDLKSVRDKVVAHLLGMPAPGVPLLTEPSVIVAEDLAPADLAGLDGGLIAAIVTELGGPTSHTAIVAGQLGVPCVVRAAGVTGITDGTVIVVDAATGRILTDPDDDERARRSTRRGREGAGL